LIMTGIRGLFSASPAGNQLGGFWLPVLVLLLLAVLILLVFLWRLARQWRTSQMSEKTLREDISRLSADFSRQLDQLQNNLAGRVAESNRDQRDINAMFLSQLQQTSQGNGQMLENMRRTVSDNLNKVAGSLQEMQAVTAEVRSLKQILGNVKTRGIFGELQLERLLSEILSSGQYERQVRIRPERQEAVDFAIRLPGSQPQAEAVLLPIDAKFPLDYFSRLLAALDASDMESAEVFRHELNVRIRQEAKKISELYLMPPKTTDFAILYLPTESLFAEVAREADQIADLYRQHRIIIAGPTSMSAILAGLQAAFRLQALEQKSLVIAQYLQEVQRDFHLYEESLTRARNRVAKALGELDDSSRKAGQVRRHLDGLQINPLPCADEEPLEEPLLESEIVQETVEETVEATVEATVI
jgi:DNA recombination protein RmuC